MTFGDVPGVLQGFQGRSLEFKRVSGSLKVVSWAIGKISGSFKGFQERSRGFQGRSSDF